MASLYESEMVKENRNLLIQVTIKSIISTVLNWVMEGHMRVDILAASFMCNGRVCKVDQICTHQGTRYSEENRFFDKAVYISNFNNERGHENLHWFL